MMGRGFRWMMGAGFVLALWATPAAAQVHVDVGVLTPRVGARVVVGAPPVYVVNRYYQPVYAPYDYRREPRWSKRERDYYKDVRKAQREYEKDLRKAEREYLKDVRDARRDYDRDVRRAERRRW